MENDVCPLCKKGIDVNDNASKLTAKGITSLQNANEMRKDEPILFITGQMIHNECRRIYIHKREINKHLETKQGTEAPIPSSSFSLRSTVVPFSFKKDCFLCSDSIEDTSLASVSRVEKEQLRENVLTHCKTRVDPWSESVQMRLLSVHDLKAAGAIYHRFCLQRFYSNRSCPTKSCPQEDFSKRFKIGKNVEEETAIAFNKVVEYLENNKDTQATVSELVEMMNGFLGDTASRAYSNVYMKTKLKEHFKEEIVFLSSVGRSNVITFKDKASEMAHEQFISKQVETVIVADEISENMESMNRYEAILTAANILKEDIRQLPTASQSFPIG